MALMASAPLRVVHGHPAETPRAPETLRAVRAFYEEGRALDERLLDRTDYIFVERQEAGAVGPHIPPVYREVFASGDARVYARKR
jgi:hypothetical protein